jgi:hypothetical protein
MLRKAAPLLSVVTLLSFVASSTEARAEAGDEPPSFEVPASVGPLTFVVYGDTRFTQRARVVNAPARRALVDHIAQEHPAAVLIGGDLVYEGSNRDDYETYRTETAPWSRQSVPVFLALGNHELRGCAPDDVEPCLENWWDAVAPRPLRPHRWYSVSFGSSLLALVLDSDSALKPGSEQRLWLEREIAGADSQVKFILILMHYPPVRDPFFPSGGDEKEVARYLSRRAQSLSARVVVVGSHVHNYERYSRDGVTYLVSGGGGAKPIPVARLFGEQSRLRTSVNFHYLRFVLEGERLTGTMVRFEASGHAGDPWTEPDHFEVTAKK